jgi:hypothetical protein
MGVARPRLLLAYQERGPTASACRPGAALLGSKSAPVWPPHMRKLDALLATPMKQPPPSGDEFGRLTAIYLRLAFTGLRQVEERFELFELF